MSLNKVVLAVVTGLLLTACSGAIKEPRLSFGKKCSVTENGQVAYSYVWLYDKKEGLSANKKECEKIND